MDSAVLVTSSLAIAGYNLKFQHSNFVCLFSLLNILVDSDCGY